MRWKSLRWHRLATARPQHQREKVSGADATLRVSVRNLPAFQRKLYRRGMRLLMRCKKPLACSRCFSRKPSNRALAASGRSPFAKPMWVQLNLPHLPTPKAMLCPMRLEGKRHMSKVHILFLLGAASQHRRQRHSRSRKSAA